MSVVKRVKKTADKSAGALAMENKLDELKTTTIVLRESELKALKKLAHDTGISNSLIIRAGLMGITQIGDDDKVKEALTKLNK